MHSANTSIANENLWQVKPKIEFFSAYFWSQSRRKSEKTSIRAFPKSTRHNAPQVGWKLVCKMLMNGDQEVILFPQFNTLVTLPSKILQTFLIGCERKNSGQVCGRLSSIPGRCIIPEGIYALDFFPNHSKIPHSWHHQKVIKSLICVVSTDWPNQSDRPCIKIFPLSLSLLCLLSLQTSPDVDTLVTVGTRPSLTRHSPRPCLLN